MIVWRSLGNGELRQGRVMWNTPDLQRLSVCTELVDLPLSVEYRQILHATTANVRTV